jgi:formylmethanofuran dehydrogenase subunit C
MKKFKKSFRVSFLPFCIGLMFAACAEEEPTGKHIINGQVTDELGSPLTNVTVVLQGQSETFTAKTDTAGKYLFDGLELGSYSISFSKEGLKSLSASLKIIYGRNTEYNCSLKNEGLLLGGTASVIMRAGHARKSGKSMSIRQIFA